MLSAAAEIIRKNTLDKEEIFNGDLFGKKQKDSVPSPLPYLISFNLDRGFILHDCNAYAKNIAVNINVSNLTQ